MPDEFGILDMDELEDTPTPIARPSAKPKKPRPPKKPKSIIDLGALEAEQPAATRELPPEARPTRPVVRAPERLEPVPLVEAGTPIDIINRILQRGVKGFGSMATGAAQLLEIGIGGMPGTSIPGYGLTPQFKGALTETVRPFEQEVAKFAEKYAPTAAVEPTLDPRNPQFWYATIPEAAGSLIPFIAGGAVTGGAKITPFILGAAQNAADTYNESLRAGKTPAQASAAGQIGAAIGVLEGIGLGQTLNRFNLKSKLIEKAINIFEEGGQEALSSFLNDVNAIVVSRYDPNRKFDSLKYAGEGLVGVILGTGVQAAPAVARTTQRGVKAVGRAAKEAITTASIGAVPETVGGQVLAMGIPLPRSGEGTTERGRAKLLARSYENAPDNFDRSALPEESKAIANLLDEKNEITTRQEEIRDQLREAAKSGDTARGDELRKLSEEVEARRVDVDNEVTKRIDDSPDPYEIYRQFAEAKRETEDPVQGMAAIENVLAFYDRDPSQFDFAAMPKEIRQAMDVILRERDVFGELEGIRESQATQPDYLVMDEDERALASQLYGEQEQRRLVLENEASALGYRRFLDVQRLGGTNIARAMQAAYKGPQAEITTTARAAELPEKPIASEERFIEDVFLEAERVDEELETIKAIRTGRMTIEQARAQGLTAKYPDLERIAQKGQGPSFAPSALQAATPEYLRMIEAEALDRGMEIILTPETLNAAITELRSLRDSLMTADPRSEDFEYMSDRAVQLSIAIEEAGEVADLKLVSDVQSKLFDMMTKRRQDEAKGLLELAKMVPEEAAGVEATILPGSVGSADDAIRITDQNMAMSRIGVSYQPSPNRTSAGVVFVTEPVMEEMVKALGHSMSGSAPGGFDATIDSPSVRELPDRMDERGLSEVADALRQAIDEAMTKGLYSFNVVNLPSATLNLNIANFKNLLHEAFHTGQNMAVGAKRYQVDYIETYNQLSILHREQLRDHPLVVKALDNTRASNYFDTYLRFDDIDARIAELAARAAAGQYNHMNLTPEESDQLLEDYLMSVGDNIGREGLEILIDYAELSETAGQIADRVLESYGITERNPKFRPIIGHVARAGAAGQRVQESRASSEIPSRPSRTDPEVNGEGNKIPPPPGDSTPTPPSDPYEPLYEQHIAKAYNLNVVNAVRNHLMIEALPYDPLEPVVFQMTDYIRKGTIEVDALKRALESHGVGLSEFLDELDSTISDYGYGLGVWGKMLKEFYRKVEADPHIASSSRRILEDAQLNLDELMKSKMMRSWWQRLLGLMRASVLTQFGTAAINAAVVSGRVPFEFLAESLAAVGDTMQGRGTPGESFGSRLAQREAQNLKPMLDILMTMSPTQRKRMKGTVKEIIGENPWVQGRLFGKYQADVDTPIGARMTLDRIDQAVEDLMAKAATAPPRQAQKLANQAAQLNLKKAKVEEDWKKANTVVGRALGGVERFYGWFNAPNWLQEFFFRGPYFLGWLEVYLSRKGMDLYQMQSEGRLGDIPRDVMEQAIDKALDFTFAYNPKIHGDVSGAELAAAYAIRAIDATGPIGFFFEAFPRWVYNAARFHYRYGPWGGFAPVMRGIKETMEKGPDSEMLSEADTERIGQAVTGTLILGIAMAMVASKDDDEAEWWRYKVPFTKKTIDIRRYQPFSSYVYVADLLARIDSGRTKDIRWPEFVEQTTGLNTRGDAPKFMQEIFEGVRDSAAGGEEGGGRTKGTFVARIPAIFLTPLLNFRDLFAQFSDIENRKLDMSDKPWWGPSLERVPFGRTGRLPFEERDARFKGLPETYDPLVPGPRKISDIPLARLVGVQVEPTQTFIGTEMARLGLSLNRFLRRDPNPEVDRYKREFASQQLDVYATILESDPTYEAADDVEKAAKIERLLGAKKVGETEIPSLDAATTKQALGMVPMEAIRRGMMKGGELQRRATGMSDVIKSLGQ